MAKKYENIENVTKLISNGAISELSKKITAAERTVSDIVKSLNAIEAARLQAKLEEERVAAEKAAAEEAAKLAAEQEASEKAQKQDEQNVTQAPAVAETAEAPSPVQQTPEKPAEQKEQQKPAKDTKTFINHDSRAPKGDKKGAPQHSPATQRPQQGGPRPQTGAKFNAPSATPATSSSQAPKKNFGPDKKKQSYDKTYVEKERRAPSKRALQKIRAATGSYA